MFEGVHPDDIQELVASIQTAVANKANWLHRYRRIDKDNNVKWIKGQSKPVEKEDGTMAWYGYLEDITQKQNELEWLRLLEQCIRNATDMVMITKILPDDKTVQIEYVNEAFTKTTGYLPEEVIGKSPKMLQGPATDPEQRHQLREAMDKWEIHEAELINYKKDGTPFWVNFTIIPIANEHGWFTHWIAVEKDVTERHNHLQAIEEQNKQLRDIAWMQSHEVRGPLTKIMGIVDFFSFKYTSQEEISNYLPYMLSSLSSAANEMDEVIRKIVTKTNAIEAPIRA
jgi:PAS domain S-box-containing protein